MTIDEFNPIITASDREALKRGYVFDPVKADRPVKFIERLIKQSVGPFEGKPLLLLDWQKAAIWRCFGWVHKETGHRRFRQLFISVPKKMGKGELASALALYMLMADGEAAPKIALAACDRKQAAQTYKSIERMVRRSPYLSAKLEYSEHYKHIKCPANDGIIETNSSDSDSPDGGNLSAVILDELHRWTGFRRKQFNVYAGSGAARSQPLQILISTAGDDRQSVMYELHQRTLKIESGELKDDIGFLGIHYGPREGEDYDPHDEATWFRFNPSLNRTVSLEGFRRDYESAKMSPESWRYWLRTRLNAWVGEAAKFIDPDLWMACQPRRELANIGAGEIWYGGLDLSSTKDISAYVKIVGNLNDGIDVFLKAWIPEEEALKIEKTKGIPYSHWASEGYIELTPGSRINYEHIQSFIQADHAVTPLAALYGDSFNATMICQLLKAAGVPFTMIRQGPLSLNHPTKTLEKLIAEGKCRHGNNPVLTWAASNCVAITDRNENITIDKSKSYSKVDPIAALVNATAGLIDAQINQAQTPPPLTSGKIIWKSY